MVKEGIWKWLSIAMAINIWTVETCLDLPQTRTIIILFLYKRRKMYSNSHGESISCIRYMHYVSYKYMDYTQYEIHIL